MNDLQIALEGLNKIVIDAVGKVYPGDPGYPLFLTARETLAKISTGDAKRSTEPTGDPVRKAELRALIEPSTGDAKPDSGHVVTRPLHGGTQSLYRFPNGYGASVIRHSFSYGGDEGKFEVGVIKYHGPGEDDYSLCYTTPVTGDVIGHVPAEEVDDWLAKIRNLPAPKPDEPKPSTPSAKTREERMGALLREWMNVEAGLEFDVTELIANTEAILNERKGEA